MGVVKKTSNHFFIKMMNGKKKKENEKEKIKEKETSSPSKPTTSKKLLYRDFNPDAPFLINKKPRIEPLKPSSILMQVKQFLPEIEKENETLLKETNEKKYNCE